MGRDYGFSFKKSSLPFFFFSLQKILGVWVFCLNVCVLCACCACRGHKRAMDPLGLELQTVVSQCMAASAELSLSRPHPSHLLSVKSSYDPGSDIFTLSRIFLPETIIAGFLLHITVDITNHHQH